MENLMQKFFLLLALLPFITITQTAKSPQDLLQSVSDKAQDHLEKGKIDQAIKEYEQYLKTHPNCYETKTYLAALYGTIGDSKKEFEFCKSAISIKPDYPGGYLNLGNAFFRKGQLNEAEKNYLKAYNIAKTNNESFPMAAAAYSLSNYYMESPYFQKAIEWASVCLDQCAIINPLDKHTKNQHRQLIKDATLNKAGSYANLKDFKTAIAIVKDFLDKNPQDSDARQMLSELNHFQQLKQSK